jgi:hypothetical protein
MYIDKTSQQKSLSHSQKAQASSGIHVVPMYASQAASMYTQQCIRGDQSTSFDRYRVKMYVFDLQMVKIHKYSLLVCAHIGASAVNYHHSLTTTGSDCISDLLLLCTHHDEDA